VTFREVNGMTQINDLAPMKISDTTPFTFKVCDTTGFSAYTGNGTVDQVKASFEHNFKSFA
jgi:ubiquitin-activating enzyme E1